MQYNTDKYRLDVSLRTPRRKRLSFIILLILFFAESLFSYSHLSLGVYQGFHIIIMTYFIIIWLKVIISEPKTPKYSTNVLLLIFLPFLSIYSCYVLHGQSMEATLIVSRMHLGWLIFFFLYYYKVSETEMLKIIKKFAIVYVAISVLQQLTYTGFGYAPFGSRTAGSTYAEELLGGVEKRFGLWRFGISGGAIVTVLLFTLLSEKHKGLNKNIFIVLILISLISQGSRVLIFAIFAAICYNYLFNKRIRYRGLYISLIVISMAILYTYKDAIFGNLLDVQDDYEEGRSFSYAYYSHEYLSNWMSILFGNGLGHKSSIYGNTIEYFEGKRVILADIGILGTLYYWGAIYVFTYIVLLLRLFFSKWLATSYKSYIVYIFLRLLVITPLWEFAGMVEQGLFVYLCFANINKNKLAYGQKRNKI